MTKNTLFQNLGDVAIVVLRKLTILNSYTKEKKNLKIKKLNISVKKLEWTQRN